jgi:hypothetical protein
LLLLLKIKRQQQLLTLRASLLLLSHSNNGFLFMLCNRWKLLSEGIELIIKMNLMFFFKSCRLWVWFPSSSSAFRSCPFVSKRTQISECPSYSTVEYSFTFGFLFNLY